MVWPLTRTIAMCSIVPLWAASGMAIGCGPSDDAGVGERDGGVTIDGAITDGGIGVPPDAGVDGTSGDAGDAASGDARADVGFVNSDAGAHDSAADVEQPPPDADVCGSGWRTLTKECDDGLGTNASARRSCSTQCRVLDVLAHAPTIVDGGPPPAGRSLGAGRHPIAVTDDDAFAVAYVETQPVVSVSLTHFGRKGVASDVVTKLSGGSTPVADSNPVIAGLSGGRFVVAYGELGGDGDELGIAMRIVTPGTEPSGTPRFANQGTAFNQHDPDVIFAGGQTVIAWVDDSNLATAPDLRFRVFDANLSPTTVSDLTLAATANAETDVALAPFAGSWAAAWREVSGGLETVRVVVVGSAAWSVGPFVAGASDKPAIVQLDATHLLVVFSAGTELADGGNVGESKIRAAILDTNAQGAVTSFDVAGATTAGQSEPNAVRVGSRVFVTWRTERGLPDLHGYAEELWLKEVMWNGFAIDSSAAEIPLPRWDAHRAGDQRRVALAASGLPAQGALVSAWDDLGGGFGAGEATEDVVVELIPAPPLRTSAGDGGT